MSTLPAAPADMNVLERHLWYCDRLREAGIEWPVDATLDEVARIYRDEYPQAGTALQVAQPIDPSTALAVRKLADVQMRSIEWVDKPLYLRRAFHLVAGRKGSGKGTHLASVAARTSRGELFGRPMNVLIIASEDSDEIDIKPRIEAAGGDHSRIYTVTSSVLLPRDVPALKQTAVEIGDVGLIILDPVASNVRGDTHAEDPVRTAIDPLNALADELDCLLIGVRHLGKNTQGGALASVLGSTAWVNVPRAVLAVAADDEEDMVFHIAVVAGNRSARGAGRSFRIDLVNIDGLKEPVTRAVDLGASTKSIDDLLGDSARDTTNRAVKKSAAIETILRELAAEPRSLDYLKAKCAADTGCSGETAYRAAQQLKAEGKVRTRNSGPGTPWLWSLTSSSELLTPPSLTTDKHTDSVTKSPLTLLTTSTPKSGEVS